MGSDFACPEFVSLSMWSLLNHSSAHIPRTALSSIYILFEFHSGLDHIPSLWT